MVALNALDQRDFVARVHHELAECVSTLAASLEPHPSLKRSFLEQHQAKAGFK
jgi:hypothetical protein